MERNVRIRIFCFFKESRSDENTIDTVIKKLALEIQEERSASKGVDTNEYLESLLEIKNRPLRNYLEVKRTGTRKESALSFRKLMDLLVQDVRLHGLGTVQ